MIISQSHGQGACHGDSGGPAFIKRRGKIILAGVTNRSYPDHAPDDCAHNVVYTKVPAYRSWIRKTETAFKSAQPNSPGAMLAENERRLSKTPVKRRKLKPAGRRIVKR